MGPAEPPPPGRGSAPSLGRRFRLLLTALILARGVVELCVMPPFEGWDEYQHVGYVVHVLETGRRATLGETEVPGSLMAAMAAFPQPRSALDQMGPRPAVSGYADYWARRGSEPAATAPAGPIKLYQAQHSWWYYRTVAPLFAAAGGVSELRRSVAALRLVNLLLTAGAAWIALGVVAHRVRSRRTAAWIGLVIAVHPLFLMNGARVSSDAPGVFLATLTVAIALGLDGRLAIRRCGGLGLLAGAAIMAKATNWSLVPFLSGCWLFAATRGQASARRAAGSALALFLGLAAVVGPEVGHNLAAYGVPTPMQEAVLNRRHGLGPIDLLRAAARVSWLAEARGLWLRDTFLAGGWSFVGKGVPVRNAYAWAVTAGLLGWAWRLLAAASGRGLRAEGARHGRRRFRLHASGPITARPAFDSAWTPVACLLLCASVTAALDYHALQCRLAWGRSTTGPWYASAALPWFLALTVSGAMAWPSRRLGSAIAATLAGCCVVGEQILLWTRMLPAYSGGAAGLEALRRIGQLQPAFLGPATGLASTAAVGVILIVAAVVIARIPVDDEGAAIGPTRGPHRPALAMPIEASSRG